MKNMMKITQPQAVTVPTSADAKDFLFNGSSILDMRQYVPQNLKKPHKTSKTSHLLFARK